MYHTCSNQIACIRHAPARMI